MSENKQNENQSTERQAGAALGKIFGNLILPLILAVVKIFRGMGNAASKAANDTNKQDKA